jgi:hypothetical protein
MAIQAFADVHPRVGMAGTSLAKEKAPTFNH